jgi:hypothetical protein
LKQVALKKAGAKVKFGVEKMEEILKQFWTLAFHTNTSFLPQNRAMASGHPENRIPDTKIRGYE